MCPINFSVRIHQRGGWWETYNPVSDGEWLHLVVVFSPASGLRAHGNDVMKIDTEIFAWSRSGLSSGHVVIGRKVVNLDSKYCTTMVDEFMLWSRSLTVEEVGQLMALY